MKTIVISTINHSYWSYKPTVYDHFHHFYPTLLLPHGAMPSAPWRVALLSVALWDLVGAEGLTPTAAKWARKWCQVVPGREKTVGFFGAVEVILKYH